MTKIEKEVVLEFIRVNNACKSYQIMSELYNDKEEFSKPLDNALQSLRRDGAIYFDNGWFTTIEDDYFNDCDDTYGCGCDEDEGCTECNEVFSDNYMKVADSHAIRTLRKIKYDILELKSQHNIYKQVEALLKELEE